MGLGRWLEEAKLQFLGTGQRNGIAFGKARVTILTRRARGGIQHTIEAQIGEAIRRDVLPNLFGGVAGGDKFLPGGVSMP